MSLFLTSLLGICLSSLSFGAFSNSSGMTNKALNEATTAHTLTFNYAKGTTDNISLKGIWAGNSNGSSETNVADSTASGGYCGKFVQSGTDTFKVYAWANSAGAAFTEANTYAVYFKYKTDANDPLTSMSFEWEGDWLIKGSVTDATTEWKEAYFTFTITDTAKLGNGTCLFDLGGKGTMYVDDFSCIPTVKTYNEGDAIGELPAFYNYQNKENGYWSVDGEEITSSSTFSWSEDKEATISYPVINPTLTFESNVGGNLARTAKWLYDNNAEEEPVTVSEEYSTFNFETYTVIDLKNGQFKPTLNKEYTLSLTVKSGTDNSCKFHIWTAGWGLVKDWNEATASSWTTLEFKVTWTTDFSTNSPFFLQHAGGDKILLVKDLSFKDVSSVIVTKDSAIGELPTPSTSEVNGYYFVGWQIDGVTVTSETIYTWDTNKTAVAVFAKFSDQLASWATTFKADLSAVCVSYGTTDKTALKTAWDKNATAFDALQEGTKALAKDVVADENGDITAQAFALYDWCVTHYDSDVCARFVNDRVESNSSNINILRTVNDNTSIIIIIIIAATFVSLLSLGFLISKKRKQVR